jgi:GGDEF domain-containing protein
MRTLEKSRMRPLVLMVGLVVLLVVAGVMYARGVDRVEVIGTLLFTPIFIALVFGRIAGGVVVAIAAAAVYGALRYPAIEAVGFDRFAGLLASRTIAFLVFGAVGGWATAALETSLNKLDLYDQIDDATGLYNARFLVQDLDLEVARSKRYNTIFSLSLVTVPGSALRKVSGRKRRRMIRDLGAILKKSVRTMDRVVHVQDDEAHRFALVLPETEKTGNEILTGRLALGLTEHMRKNGLDLSADDVIHKALTYPDDAEGLQRVREGFLKLARQQFPDDTIPAEPTSSAPSGS